MHTDGASDACGEGACTDCTRNVSYLDNNRAYPLIQGIRVNADLLEHVPEEFDRSDVISAAIATNTGALVRHDFDQDGSSAEIPIDHTSMPFTLRLAVEAKGKTAQEFWRDVHERTEKAQESRRALVWHGRDPDNWTEEDAAKARGDWGIDEEEETRATEQPLPVPPPAEALLIPTFTISNNEETLTFVETGDPRPVIRLTAEMLQEIAPSRVPTPEGVCTILQEAAEVARDMARYPTWTQGEIESSSKFVETVLSLPDNHPDVLYAKAVETIRGRSRSVEGDGA